jgi:adenine deaminase
LKDSIKRISGNIVDVLNSTIYPGTLEISGGRIIDILKDNKDYETFIIPGFIDSHLHIESSLLLPSEFARLAVRHGTIAVVCDPHEIGNVMGIDGVNYMIENSRATPLKIYFGVPSCIPSTPFETSGGEINTEEIEDLFKNNEIKFLSEVMDFQGVLDNDPKVMKKIQLARKYQKLIDGHAPGLKGRELQRYAEVGISTDHECTEIEEAIEKINSGMKIQIREGSVAKNFDALYSLIEDYPDDCMFCCDDKLPHHLIKGHINDLVKRAFSLGIDRIKVLRCACVNAVLHYGMDVGLLRRDDYADFLIVDNLEDLNILRTYINGEVVADSGRVLIPETKVRIVNNFKIQKKEVSDFFVKEERGEINVIEAIDGQLITKRFKTDPKTINGNVISDTERDILKIAVVNRYQDLPPAVGFVKNFGLKKGAIASSVAHDSHNIIAVGVRDEEICKAVNLLIENKGGLCVVCNDFEEILPLPIAGIISDKDGFEVARKYSKLDKLAKDLGSRLNAPFMTLSFMALPVIPEIKLIDKGLFDADKHEMISLFSKH